MEKKRTKSNECYTCKFSLSIPGDAHLSCTNQDPEMRGQPYGVLKGWFFYPLNFDPTWKTKDCSNYSEKKND